MFNFHIFPIFKILQKSIEEEKNDVYASIIITNKFEQTATRKYMANQEIYNRLKETALKSYIKKFHRRDYLFK